MLQTLCLWFPTYVWLACIVICEDENVNVDFLGYGVIFSKWCSTPSLSISTFCNKQQHFIILPAVVTSISMAVENIRHR